MNAPICRMERGGSYSHRRYRAEDVMDSERFHSKERLAVERRAQPNFKAIAGDSSAAAWAHMRQRLSRAERDARTARRVAVVLSGISLLGVGGVLAIVLPWSA